MHRNQDKFGDGTMKHEQILKQLVTNAETNPNVLGFFVFGSVATGTHKENSDIDVITVLQTSNSESGLNNTSVDGVKVGNLYFTYDVLFDSVENVPYLLHPLGEAKLLFDRDDKVEPLLEKIRGYFRIHPEIVENWKGYYQLLREEKAQFGYEKTTIVDVWNELEKRYSDGKTRRQFFNAFYFTNPMIFSMLKKLL